MIKFKYILLSLLLIVSVELALRMYGFCDAPLFYASDQYEYAYVPDQDRMRFGNRILINEHSMRSAALSSKDSVRILLIGDSVIDGGVMTTHDSLAATLLENRLSEEFALPIRVLNLAAKSWGPDNAAAYIQKHGDFDATLICMVFSSHDAYDNMTFERMVGVSPDHPNRQYHLALLELWDRYLIPRYLLPLWEEEKQQEQKLVPEDQPFNAGWQFFKDYCQENDIELMVYLHAELDEIKKGMYQDESIIRFVQTHEIPYILELETTVHSSFYSDNIHINAKGQKHIADVLYPQLYTKIENHLQSKKALATTGKITAH